MNTINFAGKDYNVYDTIPESWKVLEGATNHPKGYQWIHNGESLFGGKRKIGLIKEYDGK